MGIQYLAIGLVEINNRMFYTKPNNLLLDSFLILKKTWTLLWLFGGNSELSEWNSNTFCWAITWAKWQIRCYEKNEAKFAVKLMRANVMWCAIISLAYTSAWRFVTFTTESQIYCSFAQRIEMWAHQEDFDSTSNSCTLRVCNTHARSRLAFSFVDHCYFLLAVHGCSCGWRICEIQRQYRKKPISR